MADPLTQTELLRQQNAAGVFPPITNNSPTNFLPTFAGNNTALGGYDPFRAAVQLGSGNQQFNAPGQAPLPVPAAAVAPAVGTALPTAPVATPAPWASQVPANNPMLNALPTLDVATPTTPPPVAPLTVPAAASVARSTAPAPNATLNVPPAANNMGSDVDLRARNGVPNDIEYIRGGQVVPTVGSDYTPGGVPAGMMDPRLSIARGIEQQQAYRQQGLQDIMAAAREGNPNNYSFRLSRLVDAIGPNNFAALQGAGTNTINSGLAGITGAGIGANAQMYGADQATERTGMDIAQQQLNLRATPVPGGATAVIPPGGMLPIVVPTYQNRNIDANGNVTFTSSGMQAQRENAKPKEGATGRTPDGRAVTYTQGQWRATGQ